MKILFNNMVLVLIGFLNCGFAGIHNELDLNFRTDRSVTLFLSQNGDISHSDECLEFTFDQKSILESPDLEKSHNKIYSPELRQRNTMMFIMENRSSCDMVCIRFITDSDTIYNDTKAKNFSIEPFSTKKAWFFNFSDIPIAKGRIKGFRIEPLNGKGKLLIDRITFEREKVLETFAGEITSCVAKKGNIIIKGQINGKLSGKNLKISLYETSMLLKEDDIDEMEKIAEIPVSEKFEIKNIPFMNGTMTRLSSQFLAVLENSNGEYIKIAPRFYIDNWEDFEDNPYEFKLKSFTVSAVDYGAKGDAFTDDTDAIQAAIDEVSNRGGGKVILEGDSSFYGRRYIATNINMKDNVELHIEKGAILWQSQNPEDYKYDTWYGHESDNRHISWAHSLHVSNLPLVQAKSVRNIKVTGQGQIRLMDTPSEDINVHILQERLCMDKIHLMPIGFWDVENIEITNLDIIRSNNYYTAFYACKNVFIGNLKMYEPGCILNCDGISLSVGTKNVKITRTFLESNDDGVVLWAGYKDPRGILWWWPKPEEDNNIRNIVVAHSYFNSGGAKAIAFIPWGSDNPDQCMTEIDSVFVYDCVLKGSTAVGIWPDNPFNGRQPFDHQELDDHSPVKNIRIWNNKYLSPSDFLQTKPTNFISDCGILSSNDFRNRDFSNGHAYWTMEGNAGVENSNGYVRQGRLYQGLYLEEGEYMVTGPLYGKGIFFVENAVTGKYIGKTKYRRKNWKEMKIRLYIPEGSTYYLGIEGSNTKISVIKIEKL